MKMSINGMEHTNSTVMVFQSENYNQFRMIKGNRDLDMNKIKRILADIEAGTNLLKYVPILVVENDGRLDIIEGQHRFAVAKKIKSPVYYILGEKLSLYEIARMNSNTEKWNVYDFINCYREVGNKHYKRLEEVIRQYPGLTPTIAISLLMSGKVQMTGHNDIMNQFHRGQFVIEHEEEALLMFDAVSAFEFKNKWSKAFMVAIEKICNAAIYDLDELTRKVNEAGSLQSSDHWRKYLTAMEEIVSKGKQKRVAIY